MKRVYVFLCFLLLIMFTGCHNNADSKSISIESEPISIETAVSNLYKADYDYRLIQKFFDSQNAYITEGEIQGQRYRDPYKEHMKIISSPDEKDNLSNEMYFQEKDDKIVAYICTQDGLITQTIPVSPIGYSQPFGYGEDLEYSFDREETINGKVVNVYTTKYEKHIPKEYNLEEDLTATVTQEYFVDKENNVIIQIVTNLLDFNRLIAIANDMSANGTCLEDAKKRAEQVTLLNEIETLIIYNYENPTNFEFPQ